MAEQKSRVSSKRSVRTKYKQLDKKFKFLVVFGIIFCIAGIPMIIWACIWAYNTFAIPPEFDDPEYPHPDFPDYTEYFPLRPLIDTISPAIDGDGKINLNWYVPSNTYAFVLEMRLQGGEWGNRRLLWASESQYYYSGLTDGVYEFRVLAYNARGDSPWSPVKSVRVALPPPAPVLYTIRPTTDDDGIINLNWGASLGAHGYYIYWRVRGDTEWHYITKTTTLLYSHNAGEINRVLEFTVKAHKYDVVFSAYSTVRSVTVAITPDAPTLYSIDSPDYDGNINLHWSDVIGTDEYKVYQRIKGTSDWGVPIRTVDYTVCTCTISSSGTYEFSVRSVDGGIYSDYSNIKSVEVIFVPDAPILNTIDSPNYDGTPDLSWNSVSNAYEYDIYISNPSKTTWDCMRTTSDISVIFNLVPFGYGTFQFSIIARGDGGDSERSNTETVIYQEQLFPPEIPYLHVIDPSVSDDGIIYLDWDSSIGADYYEIQKSVNSGSWTVLEAHYTLGTDYTDSGLADGTYQYKVRAWNDDGESGWSDIRSVTVELYVYIPVPPTNPLIVIEDGDLITNSFSVTLTLSCDNAGTMSFRISVGGEDEDWTDSETFDFFKSIPLPQAQNNTIYEITVKFSNEYGNIEASNEITLVLDDSNGNGDDNGDEETDYTMIYILVGILVGISVIAVILTWLRKRR